MKNQDNYTINPNYHGDIKLTKNDTHKKVDLSKPTDILDHRVKSQIMPNVYSNSNPLNSTPNNPKQRVCLTKPKDIISHNEDFNPFNPFNNEEQHYQESLKFQPKNEFSIERLMTELSPMLIFALIGLLSGKNLMGAIGGIGIYLICLALEKLKNR